MPVPQKPPLSGLETEGPELVDALHSVQHTTKENSRKNQESLKAFQGQFAAHFACEQDEAVPDKSKEVYV
jgi:hypothetical protein